VRRFPALVAAAAVASLAFATAALAGKFDYPKAEHGTVVDDYHGTKVADPFRWLEDDARTSEKVRKWIEAENAITFAYLDSIPERDRIEKRLTELWDYEKYSSPLKVAGTYYYSRNDGLQNQSVWYATDALDAPARVILNPNEWSSDGTVALRGLSISDDGRYMTYGKSASGSDWSEWFVRDLSTGQDLPDHLQWLKFTRAAWTKDGRGFFYSRFDAPEEGKEYQALNLNQKVAYHRVGTPQSEDVVAYSRPEEPKWTFYSQVSDDGRYLVISISKGTADQNRLVYKDLEDPYAAPVEMIGSFENEYEFLANDGPVFYFKTDLGATRSRVVSIDIRKGPEAGLREIVPEAKENLRGVDVVGNMLVCSYLKDASSYVRVFRMDGAPVRDVKLPGLGTVSGFGGKREDLETFYLYSSFNRPPSVYHYDMITGESGVWKQAKVAFDPDDYTVEQVFYQSKDGTRVPMFLAHKKGLALDGKNPTLLYGYGGFNIAETPSFSPARLAWMEMGGVFALANLRGGGEYGEEWHLAGTKLHKQNVFDDFIAAAEWLIANKYTSRDKLAIQGGSNGGLLVGACLVQRPDLFGATLPAVGVMDMLRFQKFTAGRYWVDDYGSSDDPDEFKALNAYSPYQNIKSGVKYPPTLVTTADTDDRVVPGHSFKFAARLQEAGAGDAPLLIRVQTKAGHGSGKPTKMRIRETADLWAFLVKNLGMKLPS